MLTSKLEVLVELSEEGEAGLQKTLNELKAQEEVKQAVFKDGAILVETTLPSAKVLEMVTKSSGKRAVLQGFGDTQSAVAIMSSQSCCTPAVVGVVRFQQAEGEALVADGSVDGLRGAHGLEIHEAGDLSKGCASIGGVYKSGRLGDVTANEEGRATFRIIDNNLKVSEIIGRSVAITDKSTGDGDGGKAIACGIIARSAGIFENAKRICACDGVVVWDERDRPLAGKGRRDNCCGDRSGGDKCCK